MREAHGIEAEGLVRTFKGGIRAVDGIDLTVAPGEIYGFLGPERRREVDHGAHAHDAAAADLRHGARRRLRHRQGRAEGPLRNRRSPAGSGALDGLLTGREHIRLQTALHGLPRRERPARADELLHRVGLTQAADRKVNGYSGGMKRRLDLALALAHRPSILFLDEPTTGLDPQSRTALWQEVARLARDDGVTVFLTTQYLEEADVLADRVGIIDHGKIVAEGTPSALKAEIGRPTVEAIPSDGADPAAVARILERFGESTGGSPKGVAVRLEHGAHELAEVVRALDSAGLEVEHLQLHAPSLDDVFLAKTGRSLEGAAEEAEQEE